MNGKKVYIIIIILALMLVIYDHLTSPVLSVSSPGQTVDACAPCGAPCKVE